MREVAATSWVDPSGGNSCIRVYTTDGDGRIVERCWDTDQWYTGAFSAQGEHASATSWVQDGVLHIRVYVADANGNVSELCWDGDGDGRWITGAYRGQGHSVAATSWVDASGLHLRVYAVGDGGTTVEQCWDQGGSGWYVGAYSESTQPAMSGRPG
ncbi:MAG TPA: hypothetical protein VGD67_22605 [Pseudonocardiaceae bacterium]